MHVASSIHVTTVQETAALGDLQPSGVPSVPSVPTAGPEAFLRTMCDRPTGTSSGEACGRLPTPQNLHKRLLL